MPVKLELNNILTMLMVTTCLKPYSKIDHGSLTIVKCLSTSHKSDFAKLNSLRN